MALIDNLKRAIPKPPTPDEIQAQITAAEQDIAALESGRNDLALAALTDPAKRAELAASNKSLAEARERIDMLVAAKGAAIEQTKAANRKARRDHIRHAYSRVKAKLKERDAAAQDYATAIANAATAYQRVFACDAAARDHWQIANSGEYPIEAFNEGALQRLCAGEGWKHTPVAKNGEVIEGMALPKASASQAEFINWPQGQPDLKERFEANSQMILTVLERVVPE